VRSAAESRLVRDIASHHCQNNLLRLGFVSMPHANACQGLPEGPCPKQQQDSSVVFTTYDLFLCPACILAREQAARGTSANITTSADAAVHEISTKITKNKSRKADSAVAATRSTRQGKQIQQNTTDGTVTPTASMSAADKLFGDCFNENERRINALNTVTIDSTTISAGASSDSTAIITATAKNSADVNKPADETQVLQPTSNKKGKSCAVETPHAATSNDIIPEASAAADLQPANGVTSTEQQLTLLRAEVKCQQNIIEALQRQLKFVLSLLGIAEHDVQPITSNTVSNNNTSDRTNGSSSDSNSSTPMNTVSHAETTAVAADKSLWSTVVARQRKTQKCTNNFQQSLIAAVYCDQSERKRRESSLIVSGINEDPQQSDREVFIKLCHDEFGIQPDIVSTQRLGQVRPNQSRPLLITMRAPVQAQKLITEAKQLRRSQNQFVRDNIYINRNLTKAEAEAAYQSRVQRRQAAGRRKGTTLPSSVPPFNGGNIDTDASLPLLNIACNPQTVLPPPPSRDRQTGRHSERQQ
jgi:hypothetical protein